MSDSGLLINCIIGLIVGVVALILVKKMNWGDSSARLLTKFGGMLIIIASSFGIIASLLFLLVS